MTVEFEASCTLAVQSREARLTGDGAISARSQRHRGPRQDRHASDVTDVTNASRTLLFNLKSLDWDEELLKIFGVPRGCLPTIKTSSEVYCAISEKACDGKMAGVPVAGIQYMDKCRTGWRLCGYQRSKAAPV